MHCTNRVTSKMILTVKFKCCLISSLLFEASAFGVPSLHRFVCSVIVVFCRSVHVCGRCDDDVAFAILSDVLSASRFVVVVVFSARDEFNRSSPEELQWKIFAVEDFHPLLVLAVLCHLHGKLLVIHRS